MSECQTNHEEREKQSHDENSLENKRGDNNIKEDSAKKKDVSNREDSTNREDNTNKEDYANREDRANKEEISNNESIHTKDDNIQDDKKKDSASNIDSTNDKETDLQDISHKDIKHKEDGHKDTPGINTRSTSSIFDRPVQTSQPKQSAFLFTDNKTDQSKNTSDDIKTENGITLDPSIHFLSHCNMFILGDEQIEQRGVGKLYIKQVTVQRKNKKEKQLDKELDTLSIGSKKSSDIVSKDISTSSSSSGSADSSIKVDESSSCTNTGSSKQDSTKLFKLTMVRDKIGLLACNHYILSPLHHHTNPLVLIFSSNCDNTLIGRMDGTFLVKFKDEQTVQQFKEKYEQSRKYNMERLNIK